jgi:hypothetical protein
MNDAPVIATGRIHTLVKADFIYNTILGKHSNHKQKYNLAPENINCPGSCKSLSITDKVSAGTPWLSSRSKNGNLAPLYHL